LSCILHLRYDHTKSSSFKQNNAHFNITYWSGSVEGFLSEDTVWLAGNELSVNWFTFAEINHENGLPFLAAQFDWILWMWFRKISVQGL